MQITISGTIQEIIEELKAFLARLQEDPTNARVEGSNPHSTSDPDLGRALAKIVKSLTGNNRKLSTFLIETGKEQSGEAVASALAIQVAQLNGNVGAINRVAVGGQRIILKRKRGRKMYTGSTLWCWPTSPGSMEAYMEAYT